MTFNFKRTGAAAIAIAAAAIVASGCGGSSYSSSSSASTKSAPTKDAASGSTISTKTTSAGTVLAGAGGKTLYLFEADKNGKPTCSGDCAAAWPPAIASGKVSASGSADQSKVGTVAGSKQLTYAGHPLYYYVKDTDAEDVYGNGVEAFGAEWYALTSSGANAEGAAAKSTTDSASSGY
jgi:predicted lipoprotein with Yx(FWY)xxD motif